MAYKDPRQLHDQRPRPVSANTDRAGPFTCVTVDSTSRPSKNFWKTIPNGVSSLCEHQHTRRCYFLTCSDGNGSLFGTLSGNTREVIHKFTVDLPKKHGRGGQSALRFSRLREEARRNYVRKVAELAVQHFITNDRVNVAGLVLAGSAELKTDLSGSDLFDPRLLAKVVKIVDVSYGGENGFNQVRQIARMCWLQS